LFGNYSFAGSTTLQRLKCKLKISFAGSPIRRLLLISLLCAAYAGAQVGIVVPIGHEGAVQSLATDGKHWAATLDLKGTICVWSGDDGHYLSRLRIPGITTFARLPGGDALLLGDRDGDLRILSVATLQIGRQAKLPGQVLQLLSSADGDLFAIIDPHSNLLTTEVWRLNPSTLEGSKIASLGDNSSSSGAVIDATGTFIASTTNNNVATSKAHISVIDLRDGHRVFERDWVNLQTVALANDRIAVSTTDSNRYDRDPGHVQVLNLPDGTLLDDITVTHAPQMMLFMPENKDLLLASHRDGNTLFDLETKKSLVEVPHPGFFSEIATLGNRLFAVGIDGSPSLCDPKTLYCDDINVALPTHMSTASAIKDGSLLLTEDHGFAVRVADTVSVNRIYYGPTLGTVTKLHGKDELVAVSGDDSSMPTTSINGLLSIRKLPDFIDLKGRTAVAVSGDGRFLATRGPLETDRSVVLLDLTSFKDGVTAVEVASTWRVSGNTALSEMQFVFPHASPTLIAIERQTGNVHRYDTRSHQELAELSSRWKTGVTAWAISPLGERLLLAHKGQVEWMALGGSPGSEAIDVGGFIAAAAVTDDGAGTLSQEDGNLLQWDGTKRAPSLLAKLDGPVESMMLIPEREMLVLNMASEVTEFFSVTKRSTVFSLALFKNGRDWLSWTPAGQYDASDNGWQGLQWRFGSDVHSQTEPLEDFRDDEYFPGLTGMALRGQELAAKPPQIRDRSTPKLLLTSVSTQNNKTTLRIKVGTTKSVGAQNLRLFRNGVLLKEWPSNMNDGVELTYTADLVAGRNHFTAYAFSRANIKSEDTFSDVVGAPSLARPGELWVLAIGINDYANTALHLNYARQDAVLAAAALREQRNDVASFTKQLEDRAKQQHFDGQIQYQGFALRPSSGAVHARTLIDKEANRAGIIAALKQIATQARPEDAIVIYYAGHGVAVGDRYYILPQDFSFGVTPASLIAKGAASMAVAAVSDLDLREALAEEQASVAAVILDACQSGQLMGDSLIAARGPMNSRGLAQLAYDKHIFLLAASLSTQTAAEQKALGHGVLTASLVERGLLGNEAADKSGLAGASSANSLEAWLQWGADHIEAPRSDTSTGRGTLTDAGPRKQQQQPRLFSPANNDVQVPVLVAVNAIPWDPLTLTSQGYVDHDKNLDSKVSEGNTLSTPSPSLEVTPPSGATVSVSFASGKPVIVVQSGNHCFEQRWPTSESASSQPCKSLLFNNGFAFWQNEDHGVSFLNLPAGSSGAPLPVSENATIALSSDAQLVAWMQPLVGLIGGKSVVTVSETGTGKQLFRVKVEGDPPVAVSTNSLATLSPAGVSPLEGALLRVYGRDGEETASMHVDTTSFQQITFSPSGKQIAVADLNGNVRILDPATRRKLRSINLPHMLSLLRWLPEPDSVLIGTTDGEMYLWDPQKTEAPHFLGDIGAQVATLAFASPFLMMAGTSSGTIGWFTLGKESHLIARSTWMARTQCWITQSQDGRFDVSGPATTKVEFGNTMAKQSMSSSDVIGFTPGLVQQLLNSR
jgi:WD40 repeat protein